VRADPLRRDLGQAPGLLGFESECLGGTLGALRREWVLAEQRRDGMHARPTDPLGQLGPAQPRGAARLIDRLVHLDHPAQNVMRRRARG